MHWMDQLRGAAIVLVILFHAETVVGRFASDMPAGLAVALAFFAPFRMPLLMFLSGMLLSRSLSKPARPYFIGKLAGIGWPYLIWSFVFLAVSAQITPMNIISVALKPPTYLWYLWFLLAYYAIAWLMQRWNIPAWIGLAIGFVGAFGPDTFRFSRFCFLFTLFLAGHLYSANKERVDASLRRMWVLVASSVTTASASLASAAGMEIQYNPVFIIAPFAALALCLRILPGRVNGRLGSAAAYIGRDSIVFYVTHFTTIWLVALGLKELGVDDAWTMYGVGAVAAMAVGLGFTWARHNAPTIDALFRFPVRRMALHSTS